MKPVDHGVGDGVWNSEFEYSIEKLDKNPKKDISGVHLGVFNFRNALYPCELSNILFWKLTQF